MLTLRAVTQHTTRLCHSCDVIKRLSLRERPACKSGWNGNGWRDEQGWWLKQRMTFRKNLEYREETKDREPQLFLDALSVTHHWTQGLLVFNLFEFNTSLYTFFQQANSFRSIKANPVKIYLRCSCEGRKKFREVRYAIFGIFL